MGNLCSSSNIIKNCEVLNRPSTAKVIHINGRLQEFRVSIKASHILSQHPSSFLCSSESMYIGSHPPQLPSDHELQANTALQTRSLKIVAVTGNGHSVAKSKSRSNPLAGFEMVGKNPLVAHGKRCFEIYD